MIDLKQKAREAAQAVGGPCWAGTDIFSMGYLAAAEPREELIAELVGAIEALLQCHGCGTIFHKCKYPKCPANIGRAAIAKAEASK